MRRFAGSSRVSTSRVAPAAQTARQSTPVRPVSTLARVRPVECDNAAGIRLLVTFLFGDLQSRQPCPLNLINARRCVDDFVVVKLYPDVPEIRNYEISLPRSLVYDAGQRRARIPRAGSFFARLREY